MPPEFRTLAQARAWYDAWLSDAALPLWADGGVDSASGLFQESLTIEGRPHSVPRRFRVQARQVFVYAQAANAGLGGGWAKVAQRGYEAFNRAYRRPDGLYINCLAEDGSVLDGGVDIYEQAFALLAMAALHGADPAAGDLPGEAARILAALDGRRVTGGGFRESGVRPFQANCHMHLFESALAWEEAGVSSWSALSDELAALALSKFIDPATAVLREFFDPQWRPLEGDDGLIEPGHHFEWAWLLERWGLARGDAAARAMARRLFDNGLRGVDTGRLVAMNALWDNFSPRDPDARLWPQTEHLKAALRLGTEGQALTAARGLGQYLDVPARGAWRDKLRADGSFIEEPAPATSFYHLMVAVLELRASA